MIAWDSKCVERRLIQRSGAFLWRSACSGDRLSRRRPPNGLCSNPSSWPWHVEKHCFSFLIFQVLQCLAMSCPRVFRVAAWHFAKQASNNSSKYYICKSRTRSSFQLHTWPGSCAQRISSELWFGLQDWHRLCVDFLFWLIWLILWNVVGTPAVFPHGAPTGVRI